MDFPGISFGIGRGVSPQFIASGHSLRTGTGRQLVDLSTQGINLEVVDQRTLDKMGELCETILSGLGEDDSWTVDGSGFHDTNGSFRGHSAETSEAYKKFRNLVREVQHGAHRHHGRVPTMGFRGPSLRVPMASMAYAHPTSMSPSPPPMSGAAATIHDATAELEAELAFLHQTLAESDCRNEALADQNRDFLSRANASDRAAQEALGELILIENIKVI